MKKLALLATLLAACTGASTYYPSGQPQYASTSQTTQSTNGTSTSTTTTTATFQAYEEPAPPAPPPVAEEPTAPAPEPQQSQDPRCHRHDSLEMCVALGVVLDVGDILRDTEMRSCGKAAKALNRYADGHAHNIETLLTLEQHESPRRLAKWQERHLAEATEAMGLALDLSNRCDDNDRTQRALQRVGFRRPR